METIYDVDYFIKKFEAIPEEKWVTGIYSDLKGNHCAYGHCGSEEAKGLVQLLYTSPITINDGKDKSYQQPTPKKRILAALYDIKAMQQPKEETRIDITKSLAILPVDEKSDLVPETKLINV